MNAVHFARIGAIAVSTSVLFLGSAPVARSEATPENLQALYEAAVAEGGGVDVYSQIVPTTLETIAARWAERFPNVEFRYVRLTTAPLIERVNAELASGSPQADVVMVSDSVWPRICSRPAISPR